MTAKRTDIHRPAAIIPAHYRYYTSYALATTVDGWPVPAWNIEVVTGLRASGAAFARTGGLGKCSICGANFIYGDIWVHEPSGEHLHVGHDCADKYEMLADRSAFELEHGRLKAASAREAAKAHNREVRQAFLDAHPGLAEALETDHHIVRDIRSRFQEFRSLSDKQVALVMKIAAEARRPAAEKEKTVAAPIVGGRQTFTGTVVSAKVMETAYGDSCKMTVKVATADGVWLAWGTAPAGLLEAVADIAQQKNISRCAALRGTVVEVTAALKPGRESNFALLVRPQGKLVSMAPEVEAPTYPVLEAAEDPEANEYNRYAEDNEAEVVAGTIEF